MVIIYICIICHVIYEKKTTQQLSTNNNNEIVKFSLKKNLRPHSQKWPKKYLMSQIA